MNYMGTFSHDCYSYAQLETHRIILAFLLCDLSIFLSARKPELVSRPDFLFLLHAIWKIEIIFKTQIYMNTLVYLLTVEENKKNFILRCWRYFRDHVNFIQWLDDIVWDFKTSLTLSSGISSFSSNKFLKNK